MRAPSDEYTDRKAMFGLGLERRSGLLWLGNIWAFLECVHHGGRAFGHPIAFLCLSLSLSREEGKDGSRASERGGDSLGEGVKKQQEGPSMNDVSTGRRGP